jgi:uncharacterized membrane protein
MFLLLAACSGSSTTGSTCPSSGAPTYDSFGRQFFATFCNGCHSHSAGNRHGAPSDQVFDTEAEIRAHATDIDEVAAKGPNATNEDMPDMGGPVRSAPSDQQRALLGKFLACERPRAGAVDDAVVEGVASR